nr:FHA domain-containing protein [Kofleriaceae bacterium]
MPRLLWRDAQGIEGSIDLSSSEVRVGRAMDCAIRTDDAMVSRHHARIFWSSGGYVLEDLGSANGVYFQEQRVQNHLFKHGDAVRCGSLWLRFVDSGASSQATERPPGPPAGPGTPMMQHPGMGPAPAGGQTGHVAAVNPQLIARSGDGGMPQSGPMSASAMPETVRDNPARTPAPALGGAGSGLGAAMLGGESENEIRVLRRRIDQMQAELRAFRTNKSTPDAARRVEELENEMSTLEIERDNLKARVERGEASQSGNSKDPGSPTAKVKRALELAAQTTETAASLNDVLSAMRIEVMAAEGELERFAQALPPRSFEMIRQSLHDAAAHCDEAREILRRLRD